MTPFLATVLTAFITALATSVVPLGWWYFQQVKLQQWGSRPVIDFEITSNKILFIRNRGTLDVSEVSLFLTSYEVAAELREGGHLYIGRQLEQFSKASGVVKQYPTVAAGETVSWELQTDPALKNLQVLFYSVQDQSLEHFERHYAFRILFRNGITKQKYVFYLITSAMEGPSVFNLSTQDAFGGPIQVSERIFAIRNAIRSHQGALFDDSTSDLYQG